MAVTSLNPQGSRNAPNVIRSITGMSRNAHVGPDIQVAAAILQRAGLGALYSNIIDTPNQIYPTGPLTFGQRGNSTVDPLYLIVDVSLVWNDGSTATYHGVFDPLYGDLTETITLWGGTPTVNTNITAGWNGSGFLNFSTQPPTGLSYNGGTGGTYSQAVVPGGLSGTMTWTTYISGGTTFLGGTITITLSSVYNYVDYCGLCVSNILDTMTPGNNITNYSGSQLLSGEAAFSWIWIKAYPQYSSAWSNNYTASIVGKISRAGGVQYGRLLNNILEDNGMTSGPADRVHFQVNPYSGTTGGLMVSSVRSIISGYGMPLTLVPFRGAAVCFDADHNFSDLSNQLAPYIMCLKSCVRNNSPMGNDYKAVTFDETANASSIAWSTKAGLPSSPSQTSFSEALAASDCSTGFGCITVPYIAEISIEPQAYPLASSQLGFVTTTLVSTSFGTPLKLYAAALDQWGNFIETLSATWSLINMTGSVVSGDLTVASDSRSAVYSLAHHGSCQVQCTVPGLATIASRVIVT